MPQVFDTIEGISTLLCLNPEWKASFHWCSNARTVSLIKGVSIKSFQIVKYLKHISTTELNIMFQIQTQTSKKGLPLKDITSSFIGI